MLHQKPIGEEEAAQATSHVERQLLLCHHPVQCESIMGSQSEEKSIFLKASFQSLGIGLYGSIGLGRFTTCVGLDFASVEHIGFVFAPAACAFCPRSEALSLTVFYIAKNLENPLKASSYSSFLALLPLQPWNGRKARRVSRCSRMGS